MADDERFDPRYAAQFQRGYDPAQHQAAPVAPPPRDPAAPVRLPGGPATTAQRVPDHPVPRSVAPPPEPVAPSSRSAADDPVIAEHSDEPEPRPGFRIDWLLPALGALLLLAAVWVFQDAVTIPDSAGIGIEDYFLTLMISSLPGPLLAAAVASFTAWLVVLAIRTSRR